jgi:hypothetical protein
MKKISLFLFAAFLSVAAFSQSEKYTNAMQANISKLDSTSTAQAWADLANNFQRIADAEKTQWLPYYYASLSHVMNGYMMMTGGQTTGMADKLDPIAAKAEELLSKAEALNKTHADIYLLKKMVSTLKMMGDPMTRWQTEGPVAAAALEKAKSLDPQNPRIYMLEGQDKFYTPEQFGGSKTEAKVLFEESLKKFEAYKPESPLHPQWGKNQVQYFLAQLK